MESLCIWFSIQGNGDRSNHGKLLQHAVEGQKKGVALYLYSKTRDWSAGHAEQELRAADVIIDTAWREVGLSSRTIM